MRPPGAPRVPARLLLRGRWLLASLLLGLGGLPACLEGRSFANEPPGSPAPPSEDGGSTPDASTPPEPAAGTVRIAAFNVHRLFDTVCDSGSCGGSAYEALPSSQAFAARAERIAQALTSLKAGIVLLSEVETQASLDALQARAQGFSTAVLGELGTAASVDVAVLSRYPLREVRRHRAQRLLTRPDGTTTLFSREFLEVRLDVEGAEVIVFSAHFRSKVDDDPGRRYAEAQAARDILSAVAAERPGALVVLGGDLNDVPGSPPLEALESGGALLRVSRSLPLEELGTVWFQGASLAIDHLYRAAGASGQEVPGTFRVVRDASGGGLAGSDHAAVQADFELPRG
ncbi:endonuclease/exonuclease/phosphatase family protein [Hyalangium gracile]|uniref:endonuclease/exonuclease/phosphatase family protein n=1 Tax=Hyalangium gracile TaxID=394092 RepID=UPI001CCAAC1F|nr:endonuclease/exonuclease/phosphatase family protein [Hyalangium gracile]